MALSKCLASLSLSCEIVDRKYVLLSFGFEKFLSPDVNCCSHCYVGPQSNIRLGNAVN